MTQIKTPAKPLMHDFMDAPMTGEEIETSVIRDNR